MPQRLKMWCSVQTFEVKWNVMSVTQRTMPLSDHKRKFIPQSLPDMEKMP